MFTADDISNINIDNNSATKPDTGAKFEFTADDISSITTVTPASAESIFTNPAMGVAGHVWQGVKMNLDGVANTIADLGDRLTYAGLTEEQANRVTAMRVRTNLLKKENQSNKYQAPMELGLGVTAEGIGSAVASIGEFSLLSLVTGGWGGSALTFGQTSLDTQREAEMHHALETGDYELKSFERGKTGVIALANGAVQTFLERGLGSGKMINDVFKGKVAKTSLLKVFGKQAFEEGSEEFLQEWSDIVSEKLLGMNDASFLENFKRSTSAAITGGIVGGPVGVATHVIATRNLTEQLKKAGFDEVEATRIAETVVSQGTDAVYREAVTQDELTEHYGPGYDDLKSKVRDAILTSTNDKYINATKESREAYIETLASTFAKQLINLNDILGVGVNSLLSVSSIEQHGSALFLDPGVLGSANNVMARREAMYAKEKEIQEKINDLNRLKKASGLDMRSEQELDSLRSARDSLKKKRAVLDMYIVDKNIKGKIKQGEGDEPLADNTARDLQIMAEQTEDARFADVVKNPEVYVSVAPELEDTIQMFNNGIKSVKALDAYIGFSGPNPYATGSVTLLGAILDGKNLRDVCDLYNVLKSGSERSDYDIWMEINDKMNEGAVKAVAIAESESTLKQGANGWYDPDMKVICLGANYNAMTLPHEMAHFWLDKLFELVPPSFVGTTKSDAYLKEAPWNDDYDAIRSLWNWLGVTKDQKALTRDQQEMFAVSMENALLGKGSFAVAGVKSIYSPWVSDQYKSLSVVRYMGSDGNWHTPLITPEAVKFFNEINRGLGAPTPSGNKFTNTGDRPEQVAERTAIIDEAMKFDNELRAQASRASDLTATPEQRANEKAAELKLEQESDKAEKETQASLFGLIKRKMRIGHHTKTETEVMRDSASKFVADNFDSALDAAVQSIEDYEAYASEHKIQFEQDVLIEALRSNPRVSDNKLLDLELRKRLGEIKSHAAGQLGRNNQSHDALFVSGLSELEDAAESRWLLTHNKKLSDVDKAIETKAEAIADKLLDENTSYEEKQSLALQMLKELRAMFGVSDQESYDSAHGILNQINQVFLANLRTRAQITKFAKRFVKENMGIFVDEKVKQEFARIADEAQEVINRGLMNSEDIDEAVAGIKKVRTYQNFLADQRIDPSRVSRMLGGFQNISMSVMLSNPGTHAKNIVSNAIQRFNMALALNFGGKNNVSEELMKSEEARLKNIFLRTGMNLAKKNSLTDKDLIQGEEYRQGASWSEASNWKWVDAFQYLGLEDTYFYNKTYVDALAHSVSQIAREKGLNADELFNQVKDIQARTYSEKAIKLALEGGMFDESGKLKPEACAKIRNEAMTLADIAVFTENGGIASALSKARDRFGIVGKIFVPFVKTPANIFMQGLEVVASPFTIARKKFHGQSLDTVDYMHALYAAETACLVAAVALISGFDYEPPFERGKEKFKRGKFYDTIGIGKYRISLDTFGPAAMPMRLALSALKGKWDVGGKRSVSDIPFIGLGKDLTDAVDNPSKSIVEYATRPIPRSVTTLMRETSFNWHGDNELTKALYKRLGVDDTENDLNSYLRLLFGFFQIEN